MKIGVISILGAIGIGVQALFAACATEHIPSHTGPSYRTETSPAVAEPEAKPECTSQTMSYYIDPKFTALQRNEIRQALQDWAESTDGMVNFVENGFGVRFVTGKESDLDIQNAAAATLHLDKDKIVYNPILGLCYHCLDKTGYIYIKIVTSKPLPPGRTYQVARHEVGHYLGLYDTVVPGTVMTGVIENGYQGKGLSELDKLKFMGVWCRDNK